ncbi:MAG: inositol monophosphatase family protein [bacterium]
MNKEIKEKQIVRGVAERIARLVRPHLGKIYSRDNVGVAKSGGDITFQIDEIAEEALEDLIRERALDIAYLSEDRGLVKFGSPRYLLLVDPVNGTRSAAAGLETCCVSVALAEYKKKARIEDVRWGCLREIKSGTVFLAEKSKGLEIFDEGGEQIPVNLSQNQDLHRMFWTLELCGRPSHLVTSLLGSLIDASSLKGGFFVYSSTCYSVCRILVGELDACVDVGHRLLREFPETRRLFEWAGHGNVISQFPYDIAAAVLVAQEGGCVVTDAYGDSLDSTLLTDTSEKNMQSFLAVANPGLHQKILGKIEEVFEKRKRDESTSFR